MAERRLLVIGSQCRKLNPLSWLSEVTTRLHGLLRVPGPGGCVGISLEGRPPGLLLDPTVDETKDAIQAAIQEAARTQSTLILAYIGHGEFDENSGNFYLMPTNAAGTTQRGAVQFAEFLNDCLKPPQDRVDLVVLLDTCHAGVGAWESMARWAASRRGNLGYELLTATDDRATANAPLARALIELLERGAPEMPERFHGRDVHARLKRDHRPTQHVAFGADDDRCHLGRNVARDPGDVFWRDSPGRAQILQQTEYFQPTSDLAALVAASRTHPVVVVTGEAGVGKSTLASALARPELTGGIVPAGFAHAVAILGESITQRSLADDLERQLRRSVPGFAAAVDEFSRAVTLPEREKLDFLTKKVLGPLAYLVEPFEVRIVLDAFNQLPDGTRVAVTQAFSPKPDHLRLILTTWPDTPDCPAGHSLTLVRTDRAALDHYLQARLVPEAARTAISARAENHWLILRLLADAVLADSSLDLSHLPATVNAAYAKLLDQAGAGDAWPDRFRPVLGPLAVAGVGPVLPLSLLAHASGTLGGPVDEAAVREILAQFRGLVVRRDLETPDEHVGLFHPTLPEYLLDPSGDYTINARTANNAIVQAIEALAPSNRHRPDDPLHRYAYLREAAHRWAINDVENTLACLQYRESHDPRENLLRSSQWLLVFQRDYEKDQRLIICQQAMVAYHLGQTGDSSKALQLYSSLLSKTTSVLGPYHRDTLMIHVNIYEHLARVGELEIAIQLFHNLLPVLQRVLGHEQRETLAVRNSIAGYTGELGDSSSALRLFSLLLTDQERVLGSEHLDTLRTRHNVALWTAKTGNPGEALQLASSLLPDRERLLGRHHVSTLKTRKEIAFLTGSLGNISGALQLLSSLLLDQELVLGRDHPDTLGTRSQIIYFHGEQGEFAKALQLSSELLPDIERVLSPDHHSALWTRHTIADCTSSLGDVSKALSLFITLLRDRERLLGPDHINTLISLGYVATHSILSGDRLEGCRQLHIGLKRATARFGLDHQSSLYFRDLIQRHGCQELEPPVMLGLR